MVTVKQLVAIGVGPTQANALHLYLSVAMDRFGINTITRQAAFMAQAMHESAMFTRMEELLYYKSAERVAEIFRAARKNPDKIPSLVRNPQALANFVYAGRNGNGDEASGDGWDFRGRGIFQLTGRANYRKAGEALDQRYESLPDLVGTPIHACLTAAWYWDVTGCSHLADDANIDAITKAINGAAMEGASKRRELFKTALGVLSA